MLHSNEDADVSGDLVLIKVACVQARVVRDLSLESSPPANRSASGRDLSRVKIPGSSTIIQQPTRAQRMLRID